MERRRCLIRREGAESEIEFVNGFYVCGVFCAQPLRGMGMATSMMFRLLGSPSSDNEELRHLPHAKVFDDYGEYFPDVYVIKLIDTRSTILICHRDDACFLGMTSDSFYESYVCKVVTPGFCHVQLPFADDRTLVLPESFGDIDTSTVRFLTEESAEVALRRFEGVMRQELQTPSELDRFCDLPDSAIIFAQAYCH